MAVVTFMGLSQGYAIRLGSIVINYVIETTLTREGMVETQTQLIKMCVRQRKTIGLIRWYIATLHKETYTYLSDTRKTQIDLSFYCLNVINSPILILERQGHMVLDIFAPTNCTTYRLNIQLNT